MSTSEFWKEFYRRRIARTTDDARAVANNSDERFSLLQKRKRRAVEKFKRLPAGSKILEVGCNVGYTFQFHDSKNHHITGFDYLFEALLVCAQKSRYHQLICGTVQQLPFADKTFDGISLLNVLSLMSEPEKIVALKECSRVLKDDGLIVILDFTVSSRALAAVRTALSVVRHVCRGSVRDRASLFTVTHSSWNYFSGRSRRNSLTYRLQPIRFQMQLADSGLKHDSVKGFLFPHFVRFHNIFEVSKG